MRLAIRCRAVFDIDQRLIREARHEHVLRRPRGDHARQRADRRRAFAGPRPRGARASCRRRLAAGSARSARRRLDSRDCAATNRADPGPPPRRPSAAPRTTPPPSRPAPLDAGSDRRAGGPAAAGGDAATSVRASRGSLARRRRRSPPGSRRSAEGLHAPIDPDHPEPRAMVGSIASSAGTAVQAEQQAGDQAADAHDQQFRQVDPHTSTFEAPSARRSASSPDRAIACAEVRLAMFTHAMRSTNAVAANSISSG